MHINTESESSGAGLSEVWRMNWFGFFLFCFFNPHEAIWINQLTVTQCIGQLLTLQQ